MSARAIGPGEIFSGELVALRLVTLADCSEWYVSWLNDARVNRYLETRWSPQTLPSVRAYVSAMMASPDNYLFAVLTRPELYLAATPDSILQAAGWPRADHAIVIVGHQPTLGITAARLLAGTDAELGVRKGAIWWFVHEHRHTALRAVVSPDLL